MRNLAWTTVVAAAVVGCRGTESIAEPTPAVDEQEYASPSYFTNVRLEYTYTATGATWRVGRESLAPDEIIPRLEERLEALSAECMRVVILHPKPAPFGSKGVPTDAVLDGVKCWATQRNVALKEEYARGYVRGVTFGRRIADDD